MQRHIQLKYLKVHSDDKDLYYLLVICLNGTPRAIQEFVFISEILLISE